MRRLAAICAVLLTLIPQTLAADPKKDFDTIYGEDIKKVTAKDSLAFGARLLTDAQGLKDDPAMAAYLVDKVMDYFTRGPAGDDKTRLGEALVEQQLVLGDIRYLDHKLADALHFYQQASQTASIVKSARANETMLRTKVAQGRLDAEKHAADLEGRLAGKPADATTAKTLVKLYIVELDAPAKAVPFLAAAGDDKAAAFIKLAMGKPQDVPVDGCVDLAQWYRDQAAEASPGGKAIANGRANAYYERFLESYDKHDLTLLSVKKGLGEVRAELYKLPTVAWPLCATGGCPATPAPAPAPTAVADADTHMIENLGTCRVVDADRDSSNYKLLWDFKKDGVVAQTEVNYGFDRAGGVPERIYTRNLKWELNDKKLVVTQGQGRDVYTFPLPIAGNTVPGEYKYISASETTVSKKNLTKAPNGQADAELAKMLAPAKARTRIPGIWHESSNRGNSDASWLFCDDFTAIRHCDEEYATGKYQVKGHDFTIQMDRWDYVFPCPLDPAGTAGKSSFQTFTTTGPSMNTFQVTLTLQKDHDKP